MYARWTVLQQAGDQILAGDDHDVERCSRPSLPQCLLQVPLDRA